MSEAPSLTTPPVVLVTFDPAWAAAFADEARRLRDAADRHRAYVDHVGSTAVADLRAKPSIDILVTLADWVNANQVCDDLVALGYVLVEQVGGSDPRYFLSRTPTASSPAFNLHLTPNASAYGLNMIVFRDLLRSDPRVRKEYEQKKIELAAGHAQSLADYTRGKDGFVRQALDRWTRAYSVNRLLSHQRAELGRSSWLQVWVIALQVAIAFFAAWSVLTNDNSQLAWFAIAAVVLVILWAAIGLRQKKHRTAGDQARRAILVRSGLGELLSVPQLRTMVDQFSIDIEHQSEARVEDYFSTRRGVGPRRLADMLTESAYWTRELHRGSALLFGAGFAAGMIIFIAVMWAATVKLDHDQVLRTLRIAIAFVVLLLSSDIAGSMFGYFGAVRALTTILHRLEAAEEAGYPTSDVLLLMTDYNAVAESSPVIVPGIYRLIRPRLSRAWHKYAAAHTFKDDPGASGDRSPGVP